MPPADVLHTNSKIPDVFKAITVEPPVFFFAMAVGLVSIGNVKLYVSRTCTMGSSIFGNGTTFDNTTCSLLDQDGYNEEEKYVEYQYTRLTFVSSAIQAVPAIAFALLAGSWSDVYSRRLLIFMPLVGFLIRDVIFLIISQIDGVGPDFLLFEALQDLTGGLPVIMLGAYAHLADITTIKNRTARMCFLEFVYLAGLSIGTSMSGPLFKIGGYAPVYVLAPVLVVCGMLAVPFFVLKPKIKLEGGVLTNVTNLRRDEYDGDLILSDWTKFKEFFHFKNITKTIKCGFVKREKGKRHLIFLVLLIFAMLEIATGVERVIDVAYVRDRFPHLNFNQFNSWWRMYYSIYTIWSLLCMGIMVPVLKRIYHVTDPVIIMCSAIGSVLHTLTLLLAENRNNFFIGGFLDLFTLSGVVACRSALCSLVEPNEYGQVLALAAVLQKLTAIAWPIASLLYIATKKWHLGLIYCINETLFLVITAIAIYLLVYFRRHNLQKWPKKIKKEEEEDEGRKKPVLVVDIMK